MTAEDPIITTLACLAAGRDDVTPLLHERFVRRLPEAEALMAHMDEHMLGRMMSDLLMLVMTQPGEIEPDYLGFEISSHDAYGVAPDMFPPLLEVVRDVAREAAGDHWTEAAERAWAARLDGINAAIEQARRPA
jgi:hypothetical protein